MRVLVCGGRAYDDHAHLYAFLTEHASGASLIIHGGANGADYLAGRWAAHHQIPTEVYRPEWKRDGKAAGPLRNQRMIDEGKPDLVIAFPGNRGTADMCERARKAGIPVIEG